MLSETRYCEFIQGQSVGSNYEDYQIQTLVILFLYRNRNYLFQDKKLTDIYGSLNHYYISNIDFSNNNTFYRRLILCKYTMIQQFYQ